MHWLHMQPCPCSSPAAPSPLPGSFNGSFGSGPGGAFVLGREQWERCARTGAAGKASPREPLTFPGRRLGRGSQQRSSSVRQSHRPWSGGWPVGMIPLARLSKFQKSEKLFKILDFGFHRKIKGPAPWSFQTKQLLSPAGRGGAALYRSPSTSYRSPLLGPASLLPQGCCSAPRETAAPCSLFPRVGKGHTHYVGLLEKTEDGSISFWNKSSTWI